MPATANNPRAIQRFEVSLKAFIVREGQALFMRESDSGYWELPGGRIDVGEEWEDHAAILAREIGEELGDVRLNVRSEAVTWVRRRPTDGQFLFIVAHPAAIASGTPALSDEHSEMLWLGRDDWQGLGFPPESGYPDAIARLFDLALAGS